MERNVGEVEMEASSMDLLINRLWSVGLSVVATANYGLIQRGKQAAVFNNT